MKYIIVFFLFLISIYSCTESYDKDEINPNIEALDKLTDSLETKRIEYERMQRIILIQLDSNRTKSDFYEQVDLQEIKDFRHFLANNYIHKYSCGLVLEYDFTFHFGIGAESEYFVNTDWKTDSVVIVKYGYQGYTPMSKKDWTTFIQRFKKVKLKMYKISDLEICRKVYEFIKENNISAQFQIENKELNLYYKPNLEWLKFDGYFTFKDTSNHKDFYGNEMKTLLINLYPKDEFNIEIYTPYADLNKNIYNNIYTVYSNSSFSNNFHYKKMLNKWKKMEGFVTVFCNDESLRQLDTIVYKKSLSKL